MRGLARSGMFLIARIKEMRHEKLMCSGRGGQVIGLNPNIRIYRYSKGQYFDCHCELGS